MASSNPATHYLPTCYGCGASQSPQLPDATQSRTSLPPIQQFQHQALAFHLPSSPGQPGFFVALLHVDHAVLAGLAAVVGRASVAPPFRLGFQLQSEMRSTPERDQISSVTSAALDAVSSVGRKSAADLADLPKRPAKSSGLAAAHSMLLAGHQWRIIAAGSSRQPNFKMAPVGSTETKLEADVPASNLRVAAPDRPVVLKNVSPVWAGNFPEGHFDFTRRPSDTPRFPRTELPTAVHVLGMGASHLTDVI